MDGVFSFQKKIRRDSRIFLIHEGYIIFSTEYIEERQELPYTFSQIAHAVRTILLSIQYTKDDHNNHHNM